MRIPVLLLVLVLAIAGVLAVAIAIGEPPGATGSVHAEHPTLLQGGPSGARTGATLWIGWAFGALQIAFFGACFALGLRRPQGLGRLRFPILAGLVVYELAWTGLVLAYARFAADPSAALWGALPAPTALMLYVLWPLPLLFMAIYLWHFDEFVLGEDTLRKLRERIAAPERPGG